MLLLLAAVIAIPLGLDLYPPVPENNPLTAERIEQGRRLFFDRRLSRNGSVSCSSCHDPQRAFSDGRAVAVGIEGRKGRRNSPTLINRGYGRLFFWDGRIKTLEEQVLRPIEDPNEMDLPITEAAARVNMTPEEISRALASFLRSILSGDSPFDRFINAGRDALSAEQQAGLHVFRGKANVTCCHVGPNFTDERLHNRASRGGTANSPTRAPAGVTLRRRHCARSLARRPTCTTAASPRSKTSSNSTVTVGTLISIPTSARCV